MPMFGPPLPVPVVEVPDTGIFVDAEGWLIVPGQLPTKTLKDTLPDGTVRVLRQVLDGTVERDTFYDFTP